MPGFVSDAKTHRDIRSKRSIVKKPFKFQNLITEEILQEIIRIGVEPADVHAKNLFPHFLKTLSGDRHRPAAAGDITGDSMPLCLPADAAIAGLPK